MNEHLLFESKDNIVKKNSPIRRIMVCTGIALALALTACSPTQPQSTELKTENFQTSVMDWRQKIDDCMLDAGFEIATPQIGEDGMSEAIDMSQYDMDAFDAAYSTCAEKIGDPPVDENQPNEQEMFDTQLAFAACMRDAGYDVPDPVKGESSVTAAFGPDTDANVVEKCGQQANNQVKDH